jgi:hypothetical protein
MNLTSLAQQFADSTGQRCWVVTPRYGRPYLAFSPSTIDSSYERLQTFLPATGYASCWNTPAQLT